MSIDWDRVLDQAADDVATYERFGQLVGDCDPDTSLEELIATLSDDDRQLVEYWLDKLADWAIETWPNRDWAEYGRNNRTPKKDGKT